MNTALYGAKYFLRRKIMKTNFSDKLDGFRVLTEEELIAINGGADAPDAGGGSKPNDGGGGGKPGKEPTQHDC
jgi:bacteriocin-like protein